MGPFFETFIVNYPFLCPLWGHFFQPLSAFIHCEATQMWPSSPAVADRALGFNETDVRWRFAKADLPSSRQSCCCPLCPWSSQCSGPSSRTPATASTSSPGCCWSRWWSDPRKRGCPRRSVVMSSSSKLRSSSGLSEDLSHPQGFHSDGSAGPGRTSACGHGGALRALLRDRDCLGLEHMGGRYARPLGALGAQDG